MSLFLEAILIESTEEVERRLRKCSVSDQDNLLGQSALHLAVSRPQHLQLLLDSGADVNAIDKHEITPLMYAGALGKTKVAIKLLEAGANLWLVDSLHKRHFLFYATARVHWDTIMDILNWTLNHRELPSEARRWWTTTVLLFWSNDYQWRRRPEDLSTLLKWGADPNVLYISDEVTNKTVLCGIQDAAELGILVSHGFNKFDHKDSRGKHAHIILARECKPVLLQMCIDGGSTINHQDETGHSSLHIVVQHLRQQLIILSERDDHHYYGQRSDTIDCVKLLLRSGADPFVHDDCQCYCSKSGCTPLHFILKETSCREFNFGKDIWALELLDAIREQGDFDISKQSLLQMLHLLKFEEIELTHTCCRSSIFMSMEPKLSKDEIEEIMDEEKELAMVLDQEMEQLEKAIGDSLELHLLKALFKLQCRIQEESEKCLQPTNPPVRRLSSADKFCPKRVDHNHLGEIFTL
jgi:ankyrin repeat protein